jgi:hypothetical protein
MLEGTDGTKEGKKDNGNDGKHEGSIIVYIIPPSAAAWRRPIPLCWLCRLAP